MGVSISHHISSSDERESTNLELLQKLPNLQVYQQTTKFSIENNSTIYFSDGTTIFNIDKIAFATGYHLSYPFIKPNFVTLNNRLAGLYQHILQISNPLLAVIGQVCAALNFRFYKYQAVAVVHVFARRVALFLLRSKRNENSKGWLRREKSCFTKLLQISRSILIR